MTPPPSLVIRVAAPGDAALVLDLIKQLAAYENLLHLVENTEAMLREALFGTRPAAEALVAEVEGRPAGFALFFRNYSTFTGRPGLYLEDLFVVPEARGRGVGEALLRQLAAIAVERRCGRIEWSVIDWNVEAAAFYKRLGAVAIDEWTVFRVAGDVLAALGRPREGV